LQLAVKHQTFRMLFFPREFYPTDRVRLTVLFGKELLARKHKIDIVMQARDPSVEVGVHRFGAGTVHVGASACGDRLVARIQRQVMGLWNDLRWLARATSDHYDCILVSDKYLLACLAAVVARIRGLKFFFWLTFAFHDSHVTLAHDGLVRWAPLVRMRGHLTDFLLHNWIVPLSDHVFVQSAQMGREFCRRGADPTRLSPVVTGIDLSEIDQMRKATPKHDRTQLTIGYLGTLAAARRLEVLVEMIAELRHRGVMARLLLIGDGAVPADRARLEDRADELGVRDQMEITGYLPRHEALSLVRGADICISPIYPCPAFDGASPTKLIEYMALGRPVVANRHPDQSEVLRDSRAGVRVPWGARHFARAAHWLARRTEAEAAAIGYRGRVWVEKNRSYRFIANEFERVCLEAIAAGPKDLRSAFLKQVRHGP
jgi:glycosyltransferase involved in cell wall biosynthesis